MKIKFLPLNIEVEGDSNKSLLQLAHENKVDIKTVCKGGAACAECRVLITEGVQNILPPTKAEKQLIGSSWYLDGRRLACQVRCFGDITVDVTEQLEKEDTSHKKIRGFRLEKSQESRAVLDTLVLTEASSVESNPINSSSKVSTDSKRKETLSIGGQSKNSPAHLKNQSSQQKNISKKNSYK